MYFFLSFANRIEPYVKIKNGEFSWDENAPPALTDLNIEIKPRQHVMIVGSVGAGKSSFLQSILGEVPKLKGTVEVGGTLAYVPQQAWIFNATVKENILFGKPFDRDRYLYY